MGMFNPSHLEEIIKEFWVDEQHIRINALARHLNAALSMVSRLISGKSDISPEIASLKCIYINTCVFR